jgi:hypothetical protein
MIQVCPVVQLRKDVSRLEADSCTLQQACMVLVQCQAPIPAEKLEAALRQVLGAEVQLETAVK